jgi:hypothetical protein
MPFIFKYGLLMVLKAHQSRINTTDIRSARLPIIEKGGET